MHRQKAAVLVVFTAKLVGSKVLQELLQKQDEQLGKAICLRGGLQSDVMMLSTMPLRKIIDHVSRGEEVIRSLYGSDAESGVRSLPHLEEQVTSATRNLMDVKQQLKNLSSDHADAKRRIEDLQSSSRELKKNLDGERAKMNRKYYKDIEVRVEECTQQERAKTVSAETKLQRYQAVERECILLQHQVQSAVRELDSYEVAGLDFE